MSEYSHPEVLVSSEWIEQHWDDPKVRIVETDEDPALYFQGHIPGAVEIGWHNQLQDPTSRDYIPVGEFEELCSRSGIANDTTVVFYGDKSNWWACYAFWAFKLFGHKDCRILNGGYKFWKDSGRPMTTEVPRFPRTEYVAEPIDEQAIRAFRGDVLIQLDSGQPLIDVRSPREYTGELLHMEEYPQEGTLRGGHIPGARNVPWARTVREDGTFKSADELREIFENEAGLQSENDVIVYCRIGERSSLAWFVLKYLLGYPLVRNYDGSWLEWGNLVRVPIVKGPNPSAPIGS
ncbi:MAG: sulfurtransferase [Isosphaeraceae bacterium]